MLFHNSNNNRNWFIRKRVFFVMVISHDNYKWLHGQQLCARIIKVWQLCVEMTKVWAIFFFIFLCFLFLLDLPKISTVWRSTKFLESQSLNKRQQSPTFCTFSFAPFFPFFYLSSPLNPNTWSCVCICVCVCVGFSPPFSALPKKEIWRREISILMFKGDILFWVFEFNFVESTSNVCIEALFSWKYQ